MKSNIPALFSLTIALSVLLSGMHAKDLPALSTQVKKPSQAAIRKTGKDDAGASHGKLVGEVHNHIDKQTLKSALKVFGDQNMQADARHLKRQRHQSRRPSAPRRMRGVLSLMTSRTAALLGSNA